MFDFLALILKICEVFFMVFQTVFSLVIEMKISLIFNIVIYDCSIYIIDLLQLMIHQCCHLSTWFVENQVHSFGVLITSKKIEHYLWERKVPLGTFFVMWKFQSLSQKGQEREAMQFSHLLDKGKSHVIVTRIYRDMTMCN